MHECEFIEGVCVSHYKGHFYQITLGHRDEQGLG